MCCIRFDSICTNDKFMNSLIDSNKRERTNSRWHVEIWSQEPKFIESRENSIWIFWNSNQFVDRYYKFKTTPHMMLWSIWMSPAISSSVEIRYWFGHVMKKGVLHTHEEEEEKRREPRRKSDTGEYWTLIWKSKLAIFYYLSHSTTQMTRVVYTCSGLESHTENKSYFGRRNQTTPNGL